MHILRYCADTIYILSSQLIFFWTVSLDSYLEQNKGEGTKDKTPK